MSSTFRPKNRAIVNASGSDGRYRPFSIKMTGGLEHFDCLLAVGVNGPHAVAPTLRACAPAVEGTSSCACLLIIRVEQLVDR